MFESALPALDDGTVSESGNESKILICHKGKDKSVPPDAVDTHLSHGDKVGSCPCPCFSAADISTTARSCTGELTPVCTIGASSSLTLLCDFGPSGVIGVYLSQTAKRGSCSRTERDPFIDLKASQVTAAEHKACVDALVLSGYCR